MKKDQILIEMKALFTNLTESPSWYLTEHYTRALTSDIFLIKTLSRFGLTTDLSFHKAFVKSRLLDRIISLNYFSNKVSKVKLNRNFKLFIEVTPTRVSNYVIQILLCISKHRL